MGVDGRFVKFLAQELNEILLGNIGVKCDVGEGLNESVYGEICGEG